MRTLRVLAAGVTLLAAAFGCGLFDTGFTFSTDPQSFTIDSAALGLTVPSGTTIPAVPCTTATDVCAQATSQLSCTGQTYGCKIACKGTSCGVSATAEFAVPVDVSGKIKNNTQASVLSKVTLQRVALKVSENSLTFKTPTIDVFVGPGTATKSTDAGVVKLGTIPAIDPRTTSSIESIETTQEGRDKLSELIRNYTVPFKMLAKASLGFAGGDPIPNGRFSFEVIAYLEVNP